MERPSIIDELLIKNDSFLLAMLGLEARRKFTEAVEKWGLGWQGQTVVISLYALTKYEGMSQKQLADFVGIDPRNLVPIIDTLQERGMIRRLPNPRDRRGYQLRLTAAGEKVAKQLYEVRATVEARALASLTEDEKQTFHTLLTKLWKHSDVSRSFQVFPKVEHEEQMQHRN